MFKYKNNKLPIYKYLDISTAHITKETNELLIKNSDNEQFPVIVLKTGHGFFINIPYNIDELERELPGDLISCLGFAQKYSCRWLMLDCDAEVIDDLETYDW